MGSAVALKYKKRKKERERERYAEDAVATIGRYT